MAASHEHMETHEGAEYEAGQASGIEAGGECPEETGAGRQHEAAARAPLNDVIASTPTGEQDEDAYALFGHGERTASDEVPLRSVATPTGHSTSSGDSVVAVPQRAGDAVQAEECAAGSPSAPPPVHVGDSLPPSPSALVVNTAQSPGSLRTIDRTRHAVAASPPGEMSASGTIIPGSREHPYDLSVSTDDRQAHSDGQTASAPITESRNASTEAGEGTVEPMRMTQPPGMPSAPDTQSYHGEEQQEVSAATAEADTETPENVSRRDIPFTTAAESVIENSFEAFVGEEARVKDAKSTIGLTTAGSSQASEITDSALPEPPAASSSTAIPPPAPVDKYEAAHFQIKTISFLGREVSILLQNVNGPCPLLAICNVLLLRGGISLPSKTETVTAGHLIELVGNHLLDTNKPIANLELAVSQQQNISDVMTILPSLIAGLDVNVKFDSTTGFEFTSQAAVFDLLDITLYHGWLVDKQDTDTWHVIGGKSYNQLVELAIEYQSSLFTQSPATQAQVSEGSTSAGATAEEPSTKADLEKELDVQKRLSNGKIVFEFLEATASQLSIVGISQLHEDVKERELSVFFRNNHFSTMFKLNGALYQLVTDAGYDDQANIVWESMSIDGDTEYFDGNFKKHVAEEAEQQSKDEEEEGAGGHIANTIRDGFANLFGGSSPSSPAQSTQRKSPSSASAPSQATGPHQPKEYDDYLLALEIAKQEQENARAEDEGQYENSASAQEVVSSQAYQGQGQPNSLELTQEEVEAHMRAEQFYAQQRQQQQQQQQTAARGQQRNSPTSQQQQHHHHHRGHHKKDSSCSVQ